MYSRKLSGEECCCLTGYLLDLGRRALRGSYGRDLHDSVFKEFNIF